jgi:hypothetical protein
MKSRTMIWVFLRCGGRVRQQLSDFIADSEGSVGVPLLQCVAVANADEVCSVPFYGSCPSCPDFGVQFESDMHHAVRLLVDVHIGQSSHEYLERLAGNVLLLFRGHLTNLCLEGDTFVEVGDLIGLPIVGEWFL